MLDLVFLEPKALINVCVFLIVRERFARHASINVST